MLAWTVFLLSVPLHAAVIRMPAVAMRPALTPTPLALAGAAPSLSPAAPPLPPFLSVADPADHALVAGIVAAASESPTAMKVLAQVAQAVQERGRPVVVESAKMRELGTYNYDWGILSLRRRDLKADPRDNVPTVIHELVHFLQTDRPLPSDLLETELEAYLIDFRVSRELDLRPAPGSYDARAQRAFKRGVEPFVDFLVREYPEDGRMWRTRSRDYAERLEASLKKSTAKLEGVEAERARKLEVLERMRGLGHPETELRAYQEDNVAPLDSAARGLSRAVAWARQDLALMADPAARRRIRAYVRAVLRKARAFQPVFAGRSRRP